jgi:hypothetical protein
MSETDIQLQTSHPYYFDLNWIGQKHTVQAVILDYPDEKSVMLNVYPDSGDTMNDLSTIEETITALPSTLGEAIEIVLGCVPFDDPGAIYQGPAEPLPAPNWYEACEIRGRANELMFSAGFYGGENLYAALTLHDHRSERKAIGHSNQLTVIESLPQLPSSVHQAGTLACSLLARHAALWGAGQRGEHDLRPELA